MVTFGLLESFDTKYLRTDNVMIRIEQTDKNSALYKKEKDIQFSLASQSKK